MNLETKASFKRKTLSNWKVKILGSSISFWKEDLLNNWDCVYSKYSVLLSQHCLSHDFMICTSMHFYKCVRLCVMKSVNLDKKTNGAFDSHPHAVKFVNLLAFKKICKDFLNKWLVWLSTFFLKYDYPQEAKSGAFGKGNPWRNA